MAYTNATFYLNFEGGSDTARTALTSVIASNPSGTITRMTKAAHGLVTGAVVDLTLYTAWLNGAWKITVVDANNFDLDGAVWQATADADGTVTPRGGSSKADAWATVTSGATASRISAGDTVRVMGSPDPTLIGSAAWTQYSKNITLASAVTATISDCDTPWTGSTNVTSAKTVTQYKDGTGSAGMNIALAFTTGKVAYFATGALDLSAYQQVSFWLFVSTATFGAGVFTLRLCSDTLGNTTVATIPLPAVPVLGQWTPVTVDLGAALPSNVQSIALYAETDPGQVQVNLDNIIACKASSDPASLTLTSLIGKVCNLSWAASTVYATGDERKPSQPNRNGFRYKATTGGTTDANEPVWPQEVGVTVTDGSVVWTCVGLEDTWFGIQSISGTTVRLDNGYSTLGNAGRGYAGASETVATYKRETTKPGLLTSSTIGYVNPQKSGTITAPISFIGGWDRVGMAAQTMETWLDGQNGVGFITGSYSGGFSYLNFENISGVRSGYGVQVYNASFVAFKNCHYLHCTYGFYTGSSTGGITLSGVHVDNHTNVGVQMTAKTSFSLVRALCADSNLNYGMATGSPDSSLEWGRFRDITSRNNSYFMVTTYVLNATFSNLVTGNNATAVFSLGQTARITLNNAVIPEATLVAAFAAWVDTCVFSQKHNQIADNHLLTTEGGTIVSTTDQRHTLSGIAWKFRPTNTVRHSGYPLRLSLGQRLVKAGVPVSVTIWTRRDNTNIKGQLVVAGGQIAGVPNDVVVDCQPVINTWAISDTLTFTPSETGAIEISFRCWDGVGTTNSMWIDDLRVVVG